VIRALAHAPAFEHGLLVFALALGVGAQEADCPPVADVAQLVRCALAGSEPVSRARHEVEATRARRDVAGRLLPSNPTLELGAGRRKAESGKAEFDRSVDLLQAFEIGGQRGARVAAADTEGQLATAALQAVRAEVTAEVLTAVVELWRARATLAFARDQQQIAEQLVEVSAARQRQGLSPALDVDLAQAARVQARREQTAALQGVAVAEGRLAQVVGREMRLLEGALLTAGFAVPGGVEALEQRALTLRREALAARADAQVARAKEELLRRERVPDVTVSAGARHEEFSNVLAARLSIPLPLFRRNQGEIAEQQARVAQADAAARQAELRVRLEVRGAFQAWQLAAETAKQIEPGLEDRLQEDAGALRDAYGRGAISLATALSSLREAQSARRGLVEARVESVLTSLQVARAAGYPVFSDGGSP
jgi:cobalt-zinc-cadmium efflux system outer membrane protein